MCDSDDKTGTAAPSTIQVGQIRCSKQFEAYCRSTRPPKIGAANTRMRKDDTYTKFDSVDGFCVDHFQCDSLACLLVGSAVHLPSKIICEMHRDGMIRVQYSTLRFDQLACAVRHIQVQGVAGTALLAA